VIDVLLGVAIADGLLLEQPHCTLLRRVVLGFEEGNGGLVDGLLPLNQGGLLVEGPRTSLLPQDGSTLSIGHLSLQSGAELTVGS
jgi:hypothetical protein